MRAGLTNQQQGDEGNFPLQLFILFGYNSPKSSSGCALKQALTCDPFRRVLDKEFPPVGINKVSHYHVNAADCIFPSLHFSLLEIFLYPCVTPLLSES